MILCFSTPAHALSLGWPVQCEYGVDCFIQNYVDQDTTAAARDFTCGPLSYDGHKGTDIRLRNEVAMRAGVKVVAAADGTVRGARDGMADVSIRVGGKEAVKLRECGNGVVIHHGTGFETQYCHLMKGSIAVKQGQKVKAGDVLGAIGLSGMTEFPHLHFEVRRLGRVVDPYTSEPMGGACGASKTGLWKQTPAYMPSVLLGHGFMPAVPTAEQVRGLPPVGQIARDAQALVYWVDVMGPRAGDVLSMDILAPNGTVAVTRALPFTGNKALSFSFVGKKATEEGLVPGVHTGRVTLTRKGQDTPVFVQETKVDVPF